MNVVHNILNSDTGYAVAGSDWDQKLAIAA